MLVQLFLMKYATVKERIQELKTSQALLQKYSESNNSCVRMANKLLQKGFLWHIQQILAFQNHIN